MFPAVVYALLSFFSLVQEFEWLLGEHEQGNEVV